MPNYIITEKRVEYHYAIVEANSEEEAEKIWEQEAETLDWFEIPDPVYDLYTVEEAVSATPFREGGVKWRDG